MDGKVSMAFGMRFTTKPGERLKRFQQGKAPAQPAGAFQRLR